MTILYYTTTFCTMLICIGIFIISIIRIRLCNGKRKPRIKYTFIMSSALIGISQPVMTNLWPGATTLFLSAMVFAVLILGAPPLKNYKDTNDFFDTELYDPEIHTED